MAVAPSEKPSKSSTRRVKKRDATAEAAAADKPAPKSAAPKAESAEDSSESVDYLEYFRAQNATTPSCFGRCLQN